MSLAYCLGMFLTLIHELGHALTAKLLVDAPINMIIGSHSRDNILVQLPGIALAGFIPGVGKAYFSYPAENYSPLKSAIIFLAGPICGAIASYIAYKKLSQYNRLYITKAVSIYGIVNNGPGSITDIWLNGRPNDCAKAVSELKKYFNEPQIA